MGIKTTTLLLSLVAFCTATLHMAAQQQTTHTVKEGETLQSIAQTYGVTPYTLLQANPALQTEPNVKAGTPITIPVAPSDTPPPKAPQAQALQKPIGFLQHKVKRKETLFGLAHRYGITQEQIKRYNPQLYSGPLKKRTRLQIPRYLQSAPSEAPKWERKRKVEVEPYTVQPKETRWSIAHKYGITVDELIALNPELRQHPHHLSIGQQLQLPQPKSDSTEEAPKALFIAYTVPPKMTLYSLGKLYHIAPEAIVKLNPQLVETSGLQEGMVLRLPQPNPQAVNTQNYIFYEVKPQQTLFGLTQTLKVNREELLALNPELEKGLKAGMVLKLPKAKAETLQVKNALVLDKVNLLDSIRLENTPKLVFMLPFRLDRVSFDDLDKTRSQIVSRNDLSLSLGFYSGALVALDSVQKLGLSVAVQTYDTELSQEKVREILAKDNFANVNAIIGPLAPNTLNQVATAAATQHIPIIAPVSADSPLNHSNVFFSVPQQATLRQTLLSYLNPLYTDQNIIIIADSTHTTAHEAILANFPTAQTAILVEDRSLDLETFLTQLSPETENWVFLETQQPSTVASVTSILNSSSTQEAPIRLFTTSYNSAFETDALSNVHLSQLQFTYTSFYKAVDDNAFVKAYQKRFNGLKPDRYAVRGFDLTLDVLLKLAYKNNLFETSNLVGLTEYTGNRFNYFSTWAGGYYNSACYLMQYDNLQIKEIPLHDFESNVQGQFTHELPTP